MNRRDFLKRAGLLPAAGLIPWLHMRPPELEPIAATTPISDGLGVVNMTVGHTPMAPTGTLYVRLADGGTVAIPVTRTDPPDWPARVRDSLEELAPEPDDWAWSWEDE